MTIQTLNGGFFFPQPFGGQASGQVFTTTSSTAATNDAVAFTFDAPKTGTITGATVWLTANTGGVDLRLETTTGSGATSDRPTGTLAGTNTNAAIAAAATGARSVTFTGSYSATIGDRLALVISQSGAGGVTTSLARVSDTRSSPVGIGAHVWLETAGTYAVQSNSCQFALNYGGTYYYIPGVIPTDATGGRSGTIGNGSERGIQFKLPFPTQVMGWFTNHEALSASANYDVTLYDNTNTGSEYGIILRRSNVLGGANPLGGYGSLTTGSFNGVASLSANTIYNLVLKQTTANAVKYWEFQLIDTSITAIRGMLNGGTNLNGILRATVGATTFTTSATQLPFSMGIICSGFDDGAGGGSGAMIMSRLQAGM